MANPRAPSSAGASLQLVPNEIKHGFQIRAGSGWVKELKDKRNNDIIIVEIFELRMRFFASLRSAQNDNYFRL